MTFSAVPTATCPHSPPYPHVFRDSVGLFSLMIEVPQSLTASMDLERALYREIVPQTICWQVGRSWCLVLLDYS